MSNISVIILTHNEEKNIRECIESALPLSGEILILDDHSTDETVKIALSLGAKVLNLHDNINGFGEKRRYATANARFDWVFHLDSDERISTELANSINDSFGTLRQQDVVSVARLTFLFGKPVHHCGWYPDCKRRLYNRKHTNFSDALVHEDVTLNTDSHIIKLKGDLFHYSYPTLESLLRKQIFYAQLWGRDKAKKGRKTSLTTIPFRALFFFLKTYIIRKGFLDGKIGLWLSIANMSYECSKYLCLYAEQNKINKN